MVKGQLFQAIMMWTWCCTQEVCQSCMFLMGFKIIFYVTGINYTEAVENEGFSDTLNRIDRYFSQTFASKYTLQEVSAVAVKFRYLMDNGKTIDVDLLLSPYWDTLSEQLSAMRTVHPPLKRLM